MSRVFTLVVDRAHELSAGESFCIAQPAENLEPEVLGAGGNAVIKDAQNVDPVTFVIDRVDDVEYVVDPSPGAQEDDIVRMGALPRSSGRRRLKFPGYASRCGRNST